MKITQFIAQTGEFCAHQEVKLGPERRQLPGPILAGMGRPMALAYSVS